MYRGGLVARAGLTSLAYIGFDGVQQRTVQLSAGTDAVYTTTATDMDGTVYLPQSSSGATQCRDSRLLSGLAKVTADGQVTSSAINLCSSLTQPHILPVGSGVVLDTQPNNSGHTLVGVNATGVVWQYNAWAAVDGFAIDSMSEPIIDSSGHVVLVRSGSQQIDGAVNHQAFVTLLDGITGRIVSSWNTSSVESGMSMYPWGWAAIAPGRVYLHAAPCHAGNFCVRPEYRDAPQLYAIDMPGVGFDYPRGQALDEDNPTPSPTPDPTPTVTTPAPCLTLQFVGVRGSRSGPKDSGDWDSVLTKVRDRVAAQVKGMSSTAIHYSALPVGDGLVTYTLVYVDSKEEGKHALLKYIDIFTTRCPSTYMLVVGYSQGAHAAGDAFELLSPSERKHIILLLFGDPIFNPKQPAVDVGNYDKALSGALKKFVPHLRDIKSDARARVRNYCMKGDPICNSSAGNYMLCAANMSKCPHVLYATKGWADDGADWSVAEWSRLTKH
jgi:hypothetical protein